MTHACIGRHHHRYNDSGTALRAAAWCVEELGRLHGLAVSALAPALLLTDNTREREAILAGRYGTHVATPAGKPVHFHSRAGSKEGAAQIREHMSTVAEMFLLANATCLVSCRSGFSEVAVVWGMPRRCRMHLRECLERHGAPLRPPLAGEVQRGVQPAARQEEQRRAAAPSPATA